MYRGSAGDVSCQGVRWGGHAVWSWKLGCEYDSSGPFRWMGGGGMCTHTFSVPVASTRSSAENSRVMPISWHSLQGHGYGHPTHTSSRLNPTHEEIGGWGNSVAGVPWSGRAHATIGTARHTGKTQIYLFCCSGTPQPASTAPHPPKPPPPPATPDRLENLRSYNQHTHTRSYMVHSAKSFLSGAASNGKGTRNAINQQ